MGPVTRAWAVTDSAYREWSSIQVRISVSCPAASCQWMKSDCQHSLGSSAANRMQDDFGRLAGSGTTSPCRVRQRLTVAAETRIWWCCSRCQAIVWGPASSPCPDSSFRSRTISSTVPGGIASGEVFGRRDRGPNAASPSARDLASSRDIQPWDTPYRRAASPWLSPSAMMTRRAFDIRRPWPHGHSYVLRHAIPMS